MTVLACVTGRFQPVHRQHLELFDIALRDADHLIVAITNPDQGARREEASSAHRHRASANPFSYFQRVRLLEAALAEHGLAGRTSLVPFDLTRAEYWAEYVPVSARQVVRAYSDWERHKARLLAEAGYQVRLLDGDPADRLSASAIRARLVSGGRWESLVPPATVPLLRELLAGSTR
ncbi:MAG TPA: adenylyltransferase/cytidyltransferase family protein [Pseudonocardia sp.]